MYNDYVDGRINEIRAGFQESRIGPGTLNEIRNILDAIEQGDFCFRTEPWHSVALTGRNERAPVNEMLLHIARPQCRPASMYDAMHVIYDHGFFRQMDAIIVASAVQQAEAMGQFPISINLSVHSACSRDFWKEISPILKRFTPEHFVFEILENDYIPSKREIMTMKAVRRMGYHFALDDVNWSLRDVMRMEAFGAVADYIKVCGEMVRNWELGNAGLVSFVDRVRKMMPGATLIAEWVSSVANARCLSELGFQAVQGRSLPVERETFDLMFRRTRLPMFHPHGALCQKFAGCQPRVCGI